MRAQPFCPATSAAIVLVAAALTIGVTPIATRGQNPNIIVPNTLVGDFNFDGQVNAADGLAMASALVDPAGYRAANGLSTAELLQIGDINADAQFNNQDINAFLLYLKNGSGGPIVNPVPSMHQAMLYFSTSATNPGATSPIATAATNPQITIAQGSSITLYLWAQVNDKVVINGLSLAVQSSNPSVVTASSRSIDNSTNVSGARWSAVNSGALGSPGSATLWSGGARRAERAGIDGAPACT